MTVWAGNSGVVDSGGAVAPPPANSLEFRRSGSVDYLTMADADFGAYSADKFSLVLSIRPDVTITTARIYGKRNSGIASMEWQLELTNTNLRVQGNQTDATRFQRDFSTTFGTGAWKAILVHIDLQNATTADRVKAWVNNSALSYTDATAPTQNSLVNNSQTAHIGAQANGNNPFDGLIYQPTFINNYLASPSEVFDGSAGKLLGLSGITGAKSLLDATTATHDVFLTDWTNNGSVTTSTTIPT